MRRMQLLITAVMVSCGTCAPVDPLFADASAEAVRLAEIALSDLHGNPTSLGELAGEELSVVVFLGTECPLARLYVPRLNAIIDEFSQRGVAVIGVNSNCQDSLLDITAYTRRQQVDFPVLKDLDHRLADGVKAERTPEVFVFDANWNVKYRGRIDDQYGVGYVREQATREDLRVAITALLSGRSVDEPMTAAVGCRIGRLPAASDDQTITYHGQIAGLLRQHCVECHRDGEIGPFSLTDYDEVVGWADTMVEVIRDGRMPPWHANPAHGKFLNQRLMSEEDKQLIYHWVTNGAPRGESIDEFDLDGPTSPLPRVADWRLPRPPDQVVAMRDRPYRIAATGVIEYQYFVVDPGFAEDKWVSAAEVVPGNRSVVHHCIVFIRPPDEVGLRGFGWLSAYVPGQIPWMLPPGTARRIPAGSKLVFQMHYTPTGTPETDLTKVGILFADPGEIQEETVTMVAVNRSFRIPPHAEDYQVQASVQWMPDQGRVLSLAPHMHLRGRSFRFVARRTQDDGNVQERILLDVPHYDFNWQHVYQLAQPLALSADLTIEATATFDNSEHNLVNPDPSAHVRWGDQTWQEMMVGFLDVAVPKDAELKMPGASADDDEYDTTRRSARGTS